MRSTGQAPRWSNPQSACKEGLERPLTRRVACERPARILQMPPGMQAMDERAAIPLSHVEPSVGRALGRAFEAAQQLVVDEVRLLQLESREAMQSIARRGVWLLAGTFCLAIAWLLLLAAAVVALEGRLPLEARLALVAGTQLALGIALVAWGARGRESE
jgi:hypothetical protein